MESLCPGERATVGRSGHAQAGPVRHFRVGTPCSDPEAGGAVSLSLALPWACGSPRRVSLLPARSGGSLRSWPPHPGKACLSPQRLEASRGQAWALSPCWVPQYPIEGVSSRGPGAGYRKSDVQWFSQAPGYRICEPFLSGDDRSYTASGGYLWPKPHFTISQRRPIKSKGQEPPEGTSQDPEPRAMLSPTMA